MTEDVLSQDSTFKLMMVQEEIFRMIPHLVINLMFEPTLNHSFQQMLVRDLDLES